MTSIVQRCDAGLKRWGFRHPLYSESIVEGRTPAVSLHEYWHIVERYLDGRLHRALESLTDEQWHAIPHGAGNSIAFIALHYARKEDYIIHWIVQVR
jgi:hypothetical protein